MLKAADGRKVGGSGADSALLATYAQMPVRPVRGEGSWLIEADGTRWLDAYGGHAVASTGHCHPHVVRAVQEQAADLLFYSMAVPLPQREALAEALVARMPAPLGKVFFCNSGAEANENALHLARKWSGRSKIVSVAGGWHGRTVATLAVTDGEHYQAIARRAGIPLSIKVPFDDVAAMHAIVDGETAAVIVEPVQGMSGARDASVEFLLAAREACDRHGAALIFDEVQCGVGRSGTFTAAASVGVVPDVLTIAKGLASGIPIGAMIATPRLTAAIGAGDLGSTFGGGPVPCAAALATLEVIDQDGLLANVRAISEQLQRGARALGVPKVTGRGLLLGLWLDRPAKPVQEALWEQHVLVGTGGERVIRLLPSLSFSSAEADQLLGALGEVLR
ncbi:MAG: aspartate aminotransferase family protein [Gemmatimonadales bacterium]